MPRNDFVAKILAIHKPPLTAKILIKVNLVSHEPYPTTTSPEMLLSILSHLKDYDITVGDAPAVDLRSFEVVDSYLYKICETHDIPFLNFYHEEMRTHIVKDNYSFIYYDAFKKFNYIISLPVLKIHMQCHMTGALKNAFGYLDKRDRILMHLNKKDIHRGIAELNKLNRPQLTILDAMEILTQAQEIRHGGHKTELGYLIAGTDPVALDRFAVTLLTDNGINWALNSRNEIPYLQYSYDLGVGDLRYRLIEF